MKEIENGKNAEAALNPDSKIIEYWQNAKEMTPVCHLKNPTRELYFNHISFGGLVQRESGAGQEWLVSCHNHKDKSSHSIFLLKDIVPRELVDNLNEQKNIEIEI